MDLRSLVFGWNSWPIWNREVEVWGSRFRTCSFDRLLNLYLHRFGLMGVDDKRVFAECIRPGMTIVDVGANQGLYALLFAALTGETGRVFAFEPDPTLFRALENNCRINHIQNLEWHNFALGAKQGTGTLFRSPFNSGDNRLASAGHGDWFKQVPVRVTTLDDVMGSTRVDFIKIDVQGWELEVFKGMDTVLRTSPKIQIVFEFWPFGLKGAGGKPLQVFEHLQARGFCIHERENSVWKKIQDPQRFCDRTGEHRYVNLLAARPSGN